MKKILQLLFFFILGIFSGAKGQDSSAYAWEVNSKKIDPHTYELIFTTAGNPRWQLYGPNESISGTASVEIELQNSSIQLHKPYKESGAVKKITNPIFDNASFKVYEGPATFTATITIPGTVPQNLIGTFHYTFGRGQEEFYPLVAKPFSVKLEGGVASQSRIK